MAKVYPVEIKIIAQTGKKDCLQGHRIGDTWIARGKTHRASRVRYSLLRNVSQDICYASWSRIPHGERPGHDYSNVPRYRDFPGVPN